MIDYHDHMGERLKITDKDGNVYIGELISYEVGIMEDLDYDTIGIQTDQGKALGYYTGIPIPDIVSCEILED